jgi:hypothetical protein
MHHEIPPVNAGFSWCRYAKQAVPLRKRREPSSQITVHQFIVTLSDVIIIVPLARFV